MSSLKFNPLLSDTHSNFSLAKDIDPDSNVTLDLADCRYFIEDQFNEFLQVQNIDKNRLSFMHINTRSLQCNLNGVSNLLSNIALNFSFIGISETWLQASDHNVHLPGYNFIHEHRTESSGGGVGLYVDESFEFKGALTYFLGCVAKEYVCGITWKFFATHRSFYNTALVINIEIEQ